MTKQELIESLAECADIALSDPEVAHSDADRVLIEFINDAEVTEAYEAIEKWYG